MKVLITGASGLLGSRLMHAFPPDWQMTGTCHNHPVPGLVQCELTEAGAVDRVIREGAYDWVMHCAAIRSPDVCARDPQRAMAVNAEGARIVAAAADASGARLAYASTDYVFPGNAPPYAEHDTPAPLNIYGESKLAGEHHVLCVPRALVVRMPALYSLDLSAPNNLFAATRAALQKGEQVSADDRCVRYYTLAEEVAAAIAFLVRGDQSGVVHVSAHEPTTKLRFLQKAAETVGCDPAQVVEATGQAADRPLDSHLETARYEVLGGPAFTGCSVALEGLRKG